jgi:hypothetical protein
VLRVPSSEPPSCRIPTRHILTQTYQWQPSAALVWHGRIYWRSWLHPYAQGAAARCEAVHRQPVIGWRECVSYETRFISGIMKREILWNAVSPK